MMTDLPPKPDAETGEPRPPTAPTQFGEADNDQRAGTPPAPPVGQSPTLEYYRTSRKEATLGTAVGVVFLLLIAVWNDGSINALAEWYIWPWVLLWIGWYVYASRHRDLVRAGVDWVGGKKAWVRTYELAKIRYLPRGAGGTDLELTDSSGRTLLIKLNEIQSNHQLWNYVYLGMRHSAAGGAELNHTARVQFPELNPRS